MSPPDRPSSAHPGQPERGELGLRELVALGVGGMVGGGIFSVLGLAARLAGPGVPLAFGLGSLVALTAGYSYVRLALTYRRNGASYTYAQVAFPNQPQVAAVVGWTVVVGYIGTLALYAFTFGAYVADLLGSSGSRVVRISLSAAVLAAFATVNLRGVRSSGLVEDLLVYVKIALLAVLAVVGLTGTRADGLTPVFQEGAPAVLMTAALIFVAFEGFQLITNTIENTRNPERNIPAGIYLSIAITTVLYILLTVVALGHLTVAELVDAQEYTLAVAAEPVLGAAGRVMVAIAAVLATSSAINATLLGSSQMTATMATERTVPAFLEPRATVPRSAIVVIAMSACVLTLAGSLEFIATFSSVTFLLVTFSVGVANLRLRGATHARLPIVVSGLLLNAATLVLLLVYLAGNEAPTLIDLAVFYALTTIAAMLTSRGATRSGIGSRAVTDR